MTKTGKCKTKFQLPQDGEIRNETLLKPSDANRDQLFYIFEDNFQSDSAQSCCGVVELIDIRDKMVLSIPCTGEVYIAEFQKWDSFEGRKDTGDYETVLPFFKKCIELLKRDYGKLVVYLLPSQMKGTMGKLVKDCGFIDHGKFWNPNTRNTLHHWSLTLHKTSPKKRPNKSKSILSK